METLFLIIFFFVVLLIGYWIIKNSLDSAKPEISKKVQSQETNNTHDEPNHPVSAIMPKITIGTPSKPTNDHSVKSKYRRTYSPNEVCPHGVPMVYTCAICEPERFHEETGIE